MLIDELDRLFAPMLWPPDKDEITKAMVRLECKGEFTIETQLPTQTGTLRVMEFITAHGYTQAPTPEKVKNYLTALEVQKGRGQ